MNECVKCKGTGYVWLGYGNEEEDYEYCETCSGTGEKPGLALTQPTSED